MSANILVIVNPQANSGGAAQRNRDDSAALLRKLPDVQTVDWVLTEYAGHALELARNGTKQGYHYIFAAGGDGTISQVINGILQAAPDSRKRPIFGVLPWGTLNDFYMALIDADNPASRDGLTQPLDVGHVQMDAFEGYCCLSISIGLSSWANMQYQYASRRFGRILGALPAVFNTLLTYRRSQGVTLRLDNQPAHFRRMLAIAISNCPSVGGGVRLTPEAKIDDGLFDISLIKEVSLPRLAFLLLTARLRRHYHTQAMELSRACTIHLQSKSPLSVHLDGELIPLNDSQVRTLTINVLPAALQVVRPSYLMRSPERSPT